MWFPGGSGQGGWGHWPPGGIWKDGNSSWPRGEWPGVGTGGQGRRKLRQRDEGQGGGACREDHAGPLAQQDQGEQPVTGRFGRKQDDGTSIASCRPQLGLLRGLAEPPSQGRPLDAPCPVLTSSPGTEGPAAGLPGAAEGPGTGPWSSEPLSWGAGHRLPAVRARSHQLSWGRRHCPLGEGLQTGWRSPGRGHRRPSQALHYLTGCRRRGAAGGLGSPPGRPWRPGARAFTAAHSAPAESQPHLLFTHQDPPDTVTTGVCSWMVLCNLENVILFFLKLFVPKQGELLVLLLFNFFPHVVVKHT